MDKQNQFSFNRTNFCGKILALCSMGNYRTSQHCNLMLSLLQLTPQFGLLFPVQCRADQVWHAGKLYVIIEHFPIFDRFIDTHTIHKFHIPKVGKRCHTKILQSVVLIHQIPSLEEYKMSTILPTVFYHSCYEFRASKLLPP